MRRDLVCLLFLPRENLLRLPPIAPNTEMPVTGGTGDSGRLKVKEHV